MFRWPRKMCKAPKVSYLCTYRYLVFIFNTIFSEKLICNLVLSTSVETWEEISKIRLSYQNHFHSIQTEPCSGEVSPNNPKEKNIFHRIQY